MDIALEGRWFSIRKGYVHASRTLKDIFCDQKVLILKLDFTVSRFC